MTHHLAVYHLGSRYAFVPWLHATSLQRATAVPAVHALGIFEQIFSRGGRHDSAERHGLVDLAQQLGVAAIGRPMFLVDSSTLLLQLSRQVESQRLLVVQESGGLLSGKTPDEQLTSEPATGDWTGDSAHWPEQKKLLSMHSELAQKVRSLMNELRGRGFQPRIHYGWRSAQVQAQLLAAGRSKLKFSFHNAQRPDGTPNAYAADIIDARYGWSKEAEAGGFWQALGEEARKQGLVWGGDWVTFRDVAHVQLLANSELTRVKRESGL
jgi:hypothetical protein